MTDKSLLMAEAMNYIDDKFIEEAHSEAKGVPFEVYHRKKTFRQIAAVACLCLVAIGVARLSSLMGGGVFDTNCGMAPECAESIPPTGNSGAHYPTEDAPNHQEDGLTESTTESESDTESTTET